MLRLPFNKSGATVPAMLNVFTSILVGLSLQKRSWSAMLIPPVMFAVVALPGPVTVRAVIGIVVFTFTGLAGWVMLFASFFVASVSSRLGLKRKSVLGIAEDRIEILTLGEERPAVQGHTEEAWALNRRAEFEIISEG